VVETGGRVTRFRPGDAVFASVFDLGTGALAEFAVVPESAAALKPSNLDFVQAASIPMVGLTSWQALKERVRLKPRQKVFIPAGSGGIGTFAIQLAKHLGAKVGTTTSTGNVELVRNLGADEVIDYKQQEFEQVLRGYDAVLGTVRGDALEKSLQILNPGSTVVSLIGPPDAAFARDRGMNFLMRFVFGLLSRKIIRRAKERGAGYSFHFVHPDGRQLAEIGGLLQAGEIRPLPAPPLEHTGWSMAPYLQNWTAQVAAHLRRHSVEFVRLNVPRDGDIYFDENLDLAAASGWKP